VDIIFLVEEIENMYRNISNNSVDIIQPLCEMPYGKRFYIADPDSCLIAFVEEN
jgi:predicted enzyme related to lactoylglutathione lyase